MPGSFSPALKDVAKLSAVTALYVLAALVARPVAGVHVSLAMAWPAAGIGLGALLAFGPRVLPAIFVGAFLIDFSAAGLLVALTTAATTVVEAGVGAWLIERFAHGGRAFDRPVDGFLFAAIIAFVSAPLGAAVGVAGLIATHALAASSFPSLWLTWWLSHAAACLVISPLLMLWAVHKGIPLPIPQRANRRLRTRGARWLAQPRVIEGVAIAIVAVALCPVMFAGKLHADHSAFPLMCAFFPIVGWAALRFGGHATATVLTIFGLVAAWATAHGLGPFVQAGATSSPILLQVFLAVTGVTGLAMAAVIDQRRRLDAELHQLAVTDPLTGLANYRHLIHVIEREVGRAQRSGQPLAVLMLDVDNLKVINDRDGHSVGSRLLMRLAAALKKSCRVTDVIARHGGDEFAIVLPGCDEASARIQAARLHEVLQADQETPPISVSLGVAVYPRDGETTHALLDKADIELYSMKGHARRRPLVRPDLTSA